MAFAAAGDIQHDDLFGIDLSVSDGLDQGGQGDAGCGVDVYTFELFEEFAGCAGLFVGGHEDVAAGGYQGIVQAAMEAVRRFAVREYFGVDGFGVGTCLVGIVREHVAAAGAPGVVHRHEGYVLRYHQFHHRIAEAAVFDESLVGFPGGDGTGAAAHGLEVVVGDPADGGGCREDGGPHAVASGDVLGAPFGVEHGRLEGKVAQVDGVEVVTADLRSDQFDAGVERSVEPQGVDVLFGNGEQQRNLVVGAYFGESAGGIAGRGDHQYPFFVFGASGADVVGFGLLERTGGHPGAYLREITAEGDVEVFQPQVVGQFDAFVGDRGVAALEHPADRQPVAEAVDAVLFAADVELAVFILGADERRFVGLRVVEHPAFVFEFATGFYVDKGIAGGFEILHSVDGLCLWRAVERRRSVVSELFSRCKGTKNSLLPEWV